LIALVALAIAGAYQVRKAAAALPIRWTASRRGLTLPTVAPNLRGTR
jgi:hypothetical protein